MMSVGGGQKIILLKEALESYKNDKKKIIMFTDRYTNFTFITLTIL